MAVMLITNNDNSTKINNTTTEWARKKGKWLHRKDMAKTDTPQHRKKVISSVEKLS